MKPIKFSLYALFFFMALSAFGSPNSFAEAINSKAAVGVDAKTGGIFYAKNPNRQLPPASTTKLMTAIVAIENENFSNLVTISKNASRAHPTKMGLREGDRITVEGLLYAILLKSANDAAVALAETVAGSEEQFVHLMNKKAITIGATNTRFVNSTGLPGPSQYTTALDLSRILRYAMKYPQLRVIMATPEKKIAAEDGRTFFFRNTDKLLWSDEKVIGGKTGYTCRARHCFVFAAEDKTKTVIIALLGSPSRKSLWKGAEILISKVLDGNAL